MVGFNWYQQRTDTTSLAFISSIVFINDSIGWYSCGVGRIYKTSTGGHWLTNIISILNEIPNNFNLGQNYPNPFNIETNIIFEIPIIENYRLEIYNLLGQKIEEVFNKKITSGKYRIIYNANNLSSGIYIYRISTYRMSLSKKFILLK